MLPVYNTVSDFFTMHQAKFDLIQKSDVKFLSLAQIMESGEALQKTEELAFDFLNLINITSELNFGLTSAVLKSKENVKTTEGSLYRQLDGSAAERKVLIPSMQSHVDATAILSDLVDLKDYLDLKLAVFNSGHVYYKNLAQRR